MDPLITKPLVDLGSQVTSKSVTSFSELVALKIFGKSISKLKAEMEVEEDKVKSRWENIEKPLWLQAEAIKMNRQYDNLGSVLKKSAEYITLEENKITNDNDFFWGLLEHSKEITNDEMQGLIAKIIAGEFNSPGTYSMSTLQIIKSLGRQELEKLSFFGSFYLPGHGFLKEFFDMNEDQLDLRVKLGINYVDFLELQNLGLIQAGDHTISLTYETNSTFSLFYFDEVLNCRALQDYKNWSFPSCNELTSAGKQILQHLETKKSSDFKEWVKNYFKRKGFECL